MLPFSKYSGAGNDFVVVDAARLTADPAAAARRICPRRSGVGVDGLALVDVGGEGADAERAGELAVRFFNPDGTEFGTCGNGSRCVVRWAVDRGLAPSDDVRLRTAEGPIRARADGEDVRLVYEIEARVVSEHRLPGPERTRRCWLVSVGTPHLVMPVDRLPEGSIEPVCRPLRSHPELGPEGANVNLVERVDAGRVRIRTFERGVEGETLACGAGCMATALALSEAGEAEPRLALETRSGETLTVELGGPGAADGGRRRIELGGPARRVFEGRFPGLGSEEDGG